MNKTVGGLLTRMHHIGVMVKDVDEAVEYYQSLGIGPFGPSNLVHVDREVRGKPAPDVQNLARVRSERIPGATRRGHQPHVLRCGRYS